MSPKRRQQCRSNIRHCRKNRSTCSIRQCCFDIVAVFGDNVAGFGDIVASVDRLLRSPIINTNATFVMPISSILAQLASCLTGWQYLVAVAKYCNAHVCVCVCLSVREHISRTTRAIIAKYQFLCMLLWPWLGPPMGWRSPKGAILGVFFPTDNALYSLAFGTHKKTTEPIEMPFGMMTRVSPRYHMLDRGPEPPREGAIFWGKVAAHCKVMGHSTVRCAKTAEPNDMSFWVKTRVGPLNHALDGCANPPRGRGNCRELSGPFKSIGNLRCTVRCSVAAKGMSQSPVTSCSRKKRSFSMPRKRKWYSENLWAQAMQPIGREVGGGTTQRGRSLISTIALFT